MVSTYSTYAQRVHRIFINGKRKWYSGTLSRQIKRLKRNLTGYKGAREWKWMQMGLISPKNHTQGSRTGRIVDISNGSISEDRREGGRVCSISEEKTCRFVSCCGPCCQTAGTCWPRNLKFLFWIYFRHPRRPNRERAASRGTKCRPSQPAPALPRESSRQTNRETGWRAFAKCYRLRNTTLRTVWTARHLETR